MNFKTLIRMMHINLSTPKEVAPPLMLWSDPGEAKTSAAYALAKHYGWRKNVLITSMLDPTDIGGTPYPSADGTHTKHLKPQWFAEAMSGAPTLVIWDEITSSPAAVQATTMRIVHEGAIDDEYLPGSVRHIMIGNPVGTAANGNDMATPLANRLQHVMVDGPDLDEWLDYMNGGDNMPDLKPLDLEKRKAAYDYLMSVVVGYTRGLGSLPKENPEEIRGRFPMAYATKRSWTGFINLAATAIALGEEEMIGLIAAGTIGEPAGLQFEQARRTMDLPNADELLDGKVKWTPDPMRPDVTFAVASAVSLAAVRGDNKKSAEYKRRWAAAWPILESIMPMGEDFVALGARTLVNQRNRPANWSDDPRVVRIAKAVSPVVMAAGVQDTN